MKAAVIYNNGNTEEFTLQEVASITPASHDIRLKIIASAVNPADYKTRSGALHNPSHPFPLILGWDVSGIVIEKGSAVTEFSLGDKVYGAVAQLSRGIGTYAEEITAPASIFAHAPTSIALADSAALPLAGLTAWKALEFLESADNLLVIGAAGSVGRFIVDLALARGHKVSAYGRSTDRAILTQWSISHFYSDPSHIPNADFDAVIDTVGMNTISVVKDGGKYISISDVPPPSPERGIQPFKAEVEENSLALSAIAQLIDRGELHPPSIAKVFPLADIGSAHQLAETGGVRGKIIILPS